VAAVPAAAAVGATRASESSGGALASRAEMAWTLWADDEDRLPDPTAEHEQPQGRVGGDHGVKGTAWADLVRFELDDAWESASDTAEDASHARSLNTALNSTDAWRALRSVDCRGDLCRVDLAPDRAALEALEKRAEELGYRLYPRETREDQTGSQQLYLARRSFVVGQRISRRLAAQHQTPAESASGERFE
jgi:hypothetical protein